MSLIVLLTLTMSSLSKVALQQGQENVDKSIAKQNALLGVNIALSQLQQYAGPDQRVTARADILGVNESSSGSNLIFSKVENPYYTAVWDVSGSEDLLPGDEPKHDRNKKPAILVSGNEGLNPWKSTSSYPKGYISENTKILSSNPNAVNLVESYNNVKGENIEVKVLKRNTGQGNYAYWVGDEGVKSRVNLYNEHELNDSRTPQRWKQNQMASIPLLMGNDSSYTDTTYSHFEHNSSESVASFQKVYTNESLAFLDTKSAVMENMYKNKFHDITTYSKGVLANVRSGGLKKNLTSIITNDGVEHQNEDWLFPKSSEDVPLLSNSGPHYKYRSYINPTWGKIRDYIQTQSLYTTGDSLISQRHRI